MSFVQRLKTEFREQVWDNDQVLKLRQKFAELDTQTQSYILIGGFSFFVFILLITFFTFWGKTISMKNDIAAMEEQIRSTQMIGTKIEEYKIAARSQNQDPILRDFDIGADLAAFAERATQKSLIPKDNVKIEEEKKSSIKIDLSRISLRQLVRILFLIEQSGATTAVESLNVDTKDDPEGYLWSTITIKKGGKK
ncbi:MAG: hypothetical protein M9962_00365 [Oligoflexia bacterium]|nr:hypothetical protein [Oligoflexia bacterium]